MTAFFQYGAAETDYLRRRDKRLGAVIDRLWHIDRPVDSDLFSCVVRMIIGQQVSTKAHGTVWQRVQDALGAVDAASVLAAGPAALQALGMTGKRAAFITDFAARVQSGSFDLDALRGLNDADAAAALCTLPGVGPWTAEMVLLSGLHRPDVFSFGDLAILRGLRMVYRHREISRERFEVYRRRYSPCGSVASIYLWAVACGALPELTDPAAGRRRK